MNDFKGATNPHEKDSNEWYEFEFKEGYANGTTEFNEGKPLRKDLNYPSSPYARGFWEAYNYLTNNKSLTLREHL